MHVRQQTTAFKIMALNIVKYYSEGQNEPYPVK
jgi:hypothetical protein